MPPKTPPRTASLRERIVRAAADLLSQDGREAVSTRAVSAAAGVQAPAIYRQFSDMNALLHAAAREVLARYVRQKAARVPGDNPLEELRHGWDVHIAFGLANPDAYVLVYGAPGGDGSDEAREGYAMLRAVVARLAEAGRLRVSVDHAARVIHAGACGVTLSLIAAPPGERDARLSDTMRDMVLASITAPRSEAVHGPAHVAARAVALQAVLAEQAVLSPGERELLGEWLDRLATSESPAKHRTKRRAR